MARSKIDYGIDLGTTNSAISRMEHGEAIIKKTDTQKDTMPSCVFFNKKKVVFVGDMALNGLKREQAKLTQNNDETNGFVEFKRTMGTDKLFYSPNLDKNLTSEELSAEVLKSLKSFIKDENMNAAVITVPAAFKNNQIDATRRAAQLAGIEHVEVLQEPVAAAIAYGLNHTEKKEGFWLVFDFGGGTFDAALLKADEGMMKIVDTEGDNYLGGKNLDLAIVDEIIIPYLEKTYEMDDIFNYDDTKQIWRQAMKQFAEETKNQLSFREHCSILPDLGEFIAKDSNGKEIELDIEVTQADMERVLSPIFQKAINITKELLKRNHLSGNDIDSLILVGGPTLSPVLRKMLEQQICKPDTSLDPMTVVSKGAALYASTVNLSEKIKDELRDEAYIQIDIGYESTSVETEEFVTLKILKDKTKGRLPEFLLAEIVRSDKAWSSGRIEINEIGEVIEVCLLEGKPNHFEVNIYSPKGTLLRSEPKQFTIIQGIGGIGSMQVLPYNYGIEIRERSTNKTLFKQIKGLERNKSLPVIGTENGLKTAQDIRAGNAEDIIKIPLYQGEHNSDGTRAVYNEHVYDVIISGADLSQSLPKNSDVDLVIKINKSQKVTVSAYFPYLDENIDIQVPEIKQTVETSWLENEFRKAKQNIRELESHQKSSQLNHIKYDISELENEFRNNPHDIDNKQNILSNLRKQLKKIDELSDDTEWSSLQVELETAFEELQAGCEKNGNHKAKQAVQQLRQQLTIIVSNQDVKLGKGLLEEIKDLSVKINFYEYTVAFIVHCHRDFDELDWVNERYARQLLDSALGILERDNIDELIKITRELILLLPDYQRPEQSDNSLLVI